MAQSVQEMLDHEVVLMLSFREPETSCPDIKQSLVLNTFQKDSINY